jgi:hypothetical protein
MGTKARVTADKIEDIWAYYQKGYSDCRIAELLNVSTITVLRCRKAMEKASRGQKCEYEGLWKDSHYIADYANQAFREIIDEQEIEPQGTLKTEVRELTDAVKTLTKLIQEKF